MIFVRADKDGIPDEQSYYDNQAGFGSAAKSAFKSKEEAIEILSYAYKYRIDLEAIPELEDWLDKNVKETSPGVWGLPTEPNVLFGFSIKRGYLRVINYLTSKKIFLQVFEGTPINDYNLIRKTNSTDGDQFIPIKLMGSWATPDVQTEWLQTKLSEWVRRGNFMANPWEQNDIS